MSDVAREEFEALQERVAELEAVLEDTGSVTPNTADGLDHRDEAVLAHMRENGKRSRVALVKLYISLTDIQDLGKAKRRAKSLEQTEAFRNL